MAWLELTVSTVSGSIEDVAAALTAAGFADLVLEDQTEFEDFLEDNRAYWDYIDETLQEKLQGLSCIKLYLETADAAGLQRLKGVLKNLRQNHADWGELALSVKPLPDTDWEESWKENYPPQPIGESLVVLPYWQVDLETDRKKIILDPGLTFGTGAHPSTQMVMEFMEKFTSLPGNVTEDKAMMEQLAAAEYDLVLVNIVADVIIGLSPVLPHFLKENSRLLCSGILDTRLSDVTAALERAGLTVTDIHAKEDWRSLCAKRR